MRKILVCSLLCAVGLPAAPELRAQVNVDFDQGIPATNRAPVEFDAAPPDPVSRLTPEVAAEVRRLERQEKLLGTLLASIKSGEAVNTSSVKWARDKLFADKRNLPQLRKEMRDLEIEMAKRFFSALDRAPEKRTETDKSFVSVYSTREPAYFGDSARWPWNRNRMIDSFIDGVIKNERTRIDDSLAVLDTAKLR